MGEGALSFWFNLENPVTLLEAVNLCLRSTGETGVSSIVSNHPKFTTILAGINQVSKTLQSRNWWFNTAVRTLSPETAGPLAGKIDTSPFDAAVPTQRSLNYYPLGGVLVDGNTGIDVGVATELSLRWRYATTAEEWLTLPDTFTDYVAAVAALDYASNYDADQLQLAKLQGQVSLAKQMVNADHTRYSKVNLFAAGSTGRSLSRNYGLRYGRYE